MVCWYCAMQKLCRNPNLSPKTITLWFAHGSDTLWSRGWAKGFAVVANNAEFMEKNTIHSCLKHSSLDLDPNPSERQWLIDLLDASEAQTQTSVPFLLWGVCEAQALKHIMICWLFHASYTMCSYGQNLAATASKSIRSMEKSHIYIYIYNI